MFRRFRPRTKIIIAAVLMLIPVLLASTFHMMPAEELQEMNEMWSPAPEQIDAFRADMKSHWLHQCQVRFEEWTTMIGFLFFFGWRILACMLIGMALFEKGILSAERELLSNVVFGKSWSGDDFGLNVCCRL